MALMRVWLLLLLWSPCHANSSAAASSPLTQWDESRAASEVAQTSLLALPCRDGVILLARSLHRHARAAGSDPRTSIEPPQESDEDGTTLVCGLRCVVDDRHAASRMHDRTTALPLTLLQSGSSKHILCCAMTGFAPDVDYLTGVLQRHVESQSTVYSDSTETTPLQCVQTLSNVLRERGQWQGGRPYGIQALLIGSRQSTTDTTPWHMVTLDPSGAWRDWPYGTAIGYQGADLRRELVTSAKEKSTTNNDATIVLHDWRHRSGVQAVRWGLDACRRAALPFHQDYRYQAWIILASNQDRVATARIDPRQMDDLQASVEADAAKSHA